MVPWGGERRMVMGCERREDVWLSEGEEKQLVKWTTTTMDEAVAAVLADS